MKISKLAKEIESWIIDELKKGNITYGKPLPSELILEKKFNCNKTIVRQVFDVLKQIGVVYSIKGVGIFLTPVYQISLSKYLQKKDYTSFQIHPTSTKIPHQIANIFNFKEDNFTKNTWVSYVKIYFRDDKVIRYIISWVNKSVLFDASLNILKTKSFLEFYSEASESRLHQFEVVTFEKITTTDRTMIQIYEDDKNDPSPLIPTQYRVIFDDNYSILRISIQKDNPKYFLKFIVNQQI